MRTKTQKKEFTREELLSRVVVKRIDGPTPPDRIAAEEKFWKSIIAKILADDSRPPDID